MAVGIAYAWTQLVEARQTAAGHEDPAVRARAAATAARWELALTGMQQGTVQVGSRTPTAAPAWVTLEVLAGGFATGGHLAGGALRDHERAHADRLGLPATRLALNVHYLMSGAAGELLASGHYRVEVPEEGALLAVAWLRARGEDARADEVVRAIAPWFEALRFYPVLADTALAPRDTVRLRDAGATLAALDTNRTQPRLDTMRAALQVWTPLRDRAMAVLAAALAEAPDWAAPLPALAGDLAAAGAPATHRARATAALIAELARWAAGDPPSPPARAARQRQLERHVAAHGAPGSPAHAARRAEQAAAVAAPRHADLRRVVVARLRELPSDGGLDLARAIAPVTAEEAAAFAVPAGSAPPAYLTPKLARSVDAPLGELVERGVITSAEVLARVLAQLTAQVRASTLADPAGHRLYTALYAAFRRRRGLLLLQFQRQVQLAELPWVAALEALATADDAAALAARAHPTAAAAAGIVLRAFPHTITPNPLVSELASLSRAAALALPLVEELAVDIFEGASPRSSWPPRTPPRACSPARSTRATSRSTPPRSSACRPPAGCRPSSPRCAPAAPARAPALGRPPPTAC